MILAPSHPRTPSHGIHRVGREGCGQAESKDRMVPVRSAALGFLAEDTTVYQAQEHNALLKTAATITFISRIIDGSAITGISGLSYIDPVP